MNKKLWLFGFLAVFAVSVMTEPALAAKKKKEEATETVEATPTPAPATAPTVTVGGLVDGYFTYNFNNAGVTANGAGNNGTFFNNADNSYSLGLAEIKATATQGQGSAHVVLAYGQEGNLGLATLGWDVLQAYVSYNSAEWTFNLGRFVTWMGNEVIESNANWNYSRSLLFWYTIPLWHQGLSVNYLTSDSKVGITGYVTNGWNNPTASNNSMEKTYGLQFNFKPASTWGLIVNGILGPDPWNVNAGNSRFVFEGILSYLPSDKWSLAADFVIGSQGLGATSTPSSASFWGLDLYARYQFESDWAAAIRLEEMKDDYDVLGSYAAIPIGAATDVESRDFTLTLEHNFTPNTLLRLEGRYDYALSGGIQYSPTTSTPGPFAGGNGGQFTTTLGAVFSF